jgi:Pyridoxal-phosphate dependent enzyme
MAHCRPRRYAVTDRPSTQPSCKARQALPASRGVRQRGQPGPGPGLVRSRPGAGGHRRSIRFAPAGKLDRIRALDARLELVDGDFDMARERAADLARSDGIRLVEDSLDIETCEGAATIGLELTDTVPSFGAVLIALGGGALATGVGHVMKARAPGVEVICIQPLGAPAMTRSWRQRRVVTTGPTSTIADGVAGRRPIPAVLDDLLLVADDAVLVQEASIIAGMRMLLDHAGLVVEPSAALGIAAILEDRGRFAGAARGHHRVRQQRRHRRLSPLGRCGSHSRVLTIARPRRTGSKYKIPIRSLGTAKTKGAAAMMRPPWRARWRPFLFLRDR